MEIIQDLNRSAEETSIALGFFDGVHIGHISVISEAVLYAKQNNLVPAVFTTHQIPRSVLSGEKIGSIITLEEKLSAFEKLGAQRVYILDFRKIMNITAEDFVKDILLGCFNARHAVCGFNYHFGKGGKGGGDTLHRLCTDNGMTVTTRHRVNSGNMPVSSTRIRNAITDGDISSVNKMLGRKYGFALPVIHGNHIGRTIGIPTINQKFPEELTVPPFGAYATAVTVDGKQYCGVTDVGVKPTVGSESILIETWMPDYTGKDLYGEKPDIRFLSFIRPERKFDNLNSLKEEIVKNSIQSKQIFNLNGQEVPRL